MQAFATTPVGFKQIIKQSFQNWFPSLKLVWPFILVLVLIRELYCPNCAFINGQQWQLQMITMLVMILIDVTTWVAISVAIYRAFQLQSTTVSQYLLPMFKRSLWLLLTLFMYSAFVSFAGFLGYNLGLLLLNHATVDSPLLKLIPLLIGLPMLYMIVLMLFTLPMLILDNLSVWQAFKHSASITGPRWFRAFFAYIAIAAFIGVLREIYILEFQANMGGFVNFGIDLLSFLVLVPLVANFYVLVLHDLKLRAA